MSTPSVQPILNPATTSNVESWLKVHESLIKEFFFGLIFVFLIYKSFGAVSNYENHRFQEATATLSAQKAQDDSALAEAKATLQSYQQALQNATQQNATLATAIASRNTQVVVQEKTDASLPPTELAQRWNTLAGTTGVSNTSNGYTLTNDAALDTMDLIEQVPVLKQNVTDLQTQESNDQKALDSANSLITQGKTLITGLQTENADEVKQCSAQVTALKAEARKSKLKWFGIGVIVGFIGGHIW